MRANHLNKGVRGLWDRITGRHAKQARENEREVLVALKRDRGEKDALIICHLEEHEVFHLQVRQQKQAYTRDIE